VVDGTGLHRVPRNFLALSDEQSCLEKARAILIPVPYDSTTSFRGGAKDGPSALIDASYGLEDYDIESGLDVSVLGVHTASAVEPHMGGPACMIERVRQVVTSYLEPGPTQPERVQPDKLVGVLGGEHSVSAASVQAHLGVYRDLSVLYLDAHADLRDNYMGTPWGHASAARRLREICPVVLVGLRSLCPEERDYIRSKAVPTYPWPPSLEEPALHGEVIDHLGPNVYISIDLDVLDPALMAAVGTPEPGGMGWHEITSLLRAVGEARRIVGFDVCELSPRDGPPACSYTAAKLVYKLIVYASMCETSDDSL
jgi:agmatinase